jgi:hypothetical protein
MVTALHLLALAWIGLTILGSGAVCLLGLLDYLRGLGPRLRCLTGHHRETIISNVATRGWVHLVCMDCHRLHPLYEGVIFTPSRKYAIRRRPKGQGRAA